MLEARAQASRDPVRILTLAPLPATITGGIEEYAYGVVDGLRALGFEVRVATAQIDTYPGEPAAGSEIALRSVLFLERAVPWSPTALPRLLREVRRAELVHLHMPYPVVELLAALLARIVRRPLVVTYQMDAILLPDPGGSGPSAVGRLIGAAYRCLSARWPLLCARAIVTSSRAYVGESILLPAFETKVRIIHQGVSRSRLRAVGADRIEHARRDRLRPPFGRMVTFVGRLVPYKGVDCLLEAVPLVRTPGVLFVIGGRGPQEAALRDQVARLGLPNVRFDGFVPEEELFALFAASDVVLAPSVSELENTPITLLGALAMGVPVIGTSVGGTGETVPNDGTRGLIVPPRDPLELARAIDTLLARPRTWGPNPSPRCWDDVAREYGQLFREVLSDRAPEGTPDPSG
ncbi:MAG: glycosyltransferase [Thermoplasmata archaeon]